MLNYFEIFLILAIAVLVVWLLKMYNDKKEAEKEVKLVEKEKSEYEELGRGLAEYNQKLQEKKKQIKNEIMGMFGAKEQISNREVVEKIGIPRASVARYFDELEKQGKAKQVGKTGQNVVYKKI